MKQNSAKYEVINGIFKGLIFKGTPIVINGEKRIWNDETVGQSYIAENCVKQILAWEKIWSTHMNVPRDIKAGKHSIKIGGR